MSCCGKREKGAPEHTAKWAFMTLSDFRCTSKWTPLAYGWLWFMAIVAVAVYAVDTFTAVNLLAFDQWSSQIKPSIDLHISKWIFAGCILFSWVLCFYEWFRAIRVIRRGGVAESYMDPLAVTLQSMKPPRGWRRFLVFSELTKSKKGVDYVAFFVYFAFNGAIRVILAEGPRQAINAITLYAVMQADLIPGANAAHSGFSQFWINLKELAEKDEKQAVILFSMLFTLVIWVFSALSLIIAIVLYLVFLWHYIPQRDGRLSVYCRRKIDKRLEKIVEYKVKAAMEQEDRQKQKEEQKAELRRQKTGELLPPKPVIIRQPTLPQIGDSPDLKKVEDEKVASAWGLARQDTSTTVSTLPRYESRPPTRNGPNVLQRQPTLPDYAVLERPDMPSRTGTQGSAWSSAPSYESDAPLLANAGYAGGRSSPAPPLPSQPPFTRQNSQRVGRSQTPMSRMDTFGSQQERAFSPMSRIESVGSQHQQRSFTPVSRPNTAGSRPFSPTPAARGVETRTAQEARGPPMRSNTGFSFDDQSQPVVGPMDPYNNRPVGPPRRQNTQESFHSAPFPMNRQKSQDTVASSFSRPIYGSLHSHKSSFSRPTPPPAQEARNMSSASNATRPFTPLAHAGLPNSPAAESYEMTAQPPYASLRTALPAPTAPAADNAASYVAFNPTLHSGTPPPPSQLHSGPRRNVTLPTNQQPVEATDYFGNIQAVPQRSATAPLAAEDSRRPQNNGNRLTTGYADILDDYGSARNSISPVSESPSAIDGYGAPSYGSALRRPSPPAALTPRAHTTGPIAPPDGPQQGRGWRQ
ncbi:hypothetical protein B0A50_04948 [Salinomyces thailandicus]|uniref:Pheromone-regulated membrane protein 6 n=1 Tax=Salinomyces thailandicus TaxID=706561 RepID=A0A4U0TY11_9PEZI|nr:hypothetical protein B0A50_04948 [Salinomyces thailandica]